MADCRASPESPSGRLRYRNPALETGADHLEGLGAGLSSSTQSAFSGPRRRSLRSKSVLHDTSHSSSSIWVDSDKGNPRKAKGGRDTPGKGSEASSSYSTPSSTSAFAELGTKKEQDSAGFLPKLSRILEGKESKTLRRRRDSTTSSSVDYTPVRRRRRPVEDVSLGRRPIRQKHGSLQRRAESLSNLPNPSLISVLSGLTHHSSTSSGSNSTITQKSYDKSHITKHKLSKERKRLKSNNTSTRTKRTNMEPPQAGVFQYMNAGLTSDHFLNGQPYDVRPSSSSSSASSYTNERGDEMSTDADEPLIESPMTSPASLRRSYHEESQLQHGVPEPTYMTDHSFSSSPIVPNHIDHDNNVDEEEEEEEEEDGDDDDNNRDENEDEDDSDEGVSDEDAYSADDHDDHDDRSAGHAQHMALERAAAPPRLPSAASSRHSDPHIRRLRQQEQEIRDHVSQNLQSPQPHRDFQFVGGPSPHLHPPMPLYDTYAPSGPSPVDYYVPAPHDPAGWPPPAPPPPPIGYYSPPHAPPAPYSPGSANSFAMATRPPMAAPSAAVPVPQFPPGPVQPPHYQQHSIGPDLSKTTVVGYELLADKLSEHAKADNNVSKEAGIVPMYRKFEHLNHRVLLHLQDEISELEEELRYLDECIAQSSPGDETGRLPPASRRGDARFGGELQYRRTELLGRVYLKLGQYNSALASFSNMAKNLGATSSEDVQAYRSWMEKRRPIEHGEARFLEHANDLVSITPARSASLVGGAGQHQSAAMWLPLILFLPLMVFAIVPGLLGRLFIIMVIGAAEVKLVTSTELMDQLTVREWAVCASVYFGVLALLAALTH